MFCRKLSFFLTEIIGPPNRPDASLKVGSTNKAVFFFYGMFFFLLRDRVWDSGRRPKGTVQQCGQLGNFYVRSSYFNFKRFGNIFAGFFGWIIFKEEIFKESKYLWVLFLSEW